MEDYYTTTNLFVSAYLLSRGMELVETKKIGSMTNFMFEDAKASQAMSLDYYNGGIIEARKFVEAYVSLRKMVKNRRQEDN